MRESVFRELHPKQARYQASLQPDSGDRNVPILAQGLRRTFRDSRASRLAGSPEALPLPSRYQANINLLKTHDKLAKGRGLVGARLGSLPLRYLPAPAGDGSITMRTSKRILNWELSAAKAEPLVEAEAVIILFYYMQRVVPQVWSDLIARTSSAPTKEDLEKAVAAWAVKWWLCGPAGPTEWALLIGVATARAVLSVPVIQLPPSADILICIFTESRSSLPHRRIVATARRLLIGIDAAKSMFFASTTTPVRCQQAGAAPRDIPIPTLRESSSDHRSWFSRWCFTLYRRSIRSKFAALKGGCPVTTRPLDIAVEFAGRLIWSPATGPAGNELMDKVSTAIEELRQRFKAAISPMVSGEQPTTDRDRTRKIIWFIRHTIGGKSFTKIGQTADKFLENESGYYPAECDRG